MRFKGRPWSREGAVISRVAEWLVVQAQRRKIRPSIPGKKRLQRNFENPRTYSEKVQFRKLYGNTISTPWVADEVSRPALRGIEGRRE